MWCTSCQQDVPAIASPEDRRVRCARCRSELGPRVVSPPDQEHDSPAEADGRERPATDPVPSYAFFEQPPFDLDRWDWDELYDAQRLVRSYRETVADNSNQMTNGAVHQPGAPQPNLKTAPSAAGPAAKKPLKPRTRRFSFLAWTALSLGTMAFVFGAVLLACSFLQERPELWRLGLPFAIGGQAALLLGLVLQLDGLWQSNHEAVQTLSELDQQLDELRRATSQLSSSHSGPAQSFYFHLAEGCSPHMLLADLKGQLDLLATRIGDGK